MSKKSHGWWFNLPKSDDEVHHEEDEYAWAYDDDEEDEDEDDERYADEDRISSRPWGDDNDG